MAHFTGLRVGHSKGKRRASDVVILDSNEPINNFPDLDKDFTYEELKLVKRAHWTLNGL